MKFFHVLTYFNLAFILVACNTQPLLPTAATSSTPTPPAAHYFAPHTADEAQEILTQSEQVILKEIENLEMPLSQYSLLYRAAFYAAWNASLYFPDDPRAETWKWKMAYYAAMDGDSKFATSIYIEKVTKALNEENVRIEDLPSWFRSGELKEEYITPHFDFEIQPTNIPGDNQVYLAQLGVHGGIDIPGMMCLVIAKHEDRDAVYLAYDGFPDGGFFPTLRNPSFCTLEDATGDGVEEVIAHNWSGGHVGTGSLQVIDISKLPPKILPFNSLKDEKVSGWNGSAGDFTNKGGKIQIPMSETLGQCDLYLTRYYEWNGSWFDLKNVSLEREEVGFSSLKDCYGNISYSSDKDTVFEKAQILDEAIRVYSPGSDSEKDILEEFRIKKGLAYLFSGNSDKAHEVFEEIASTPLKKDGIWVNPVKNFLKIYQKPSDVYKACVALTACDPNRPLMFEDPKHPNCAIRNPCQIQALDYVMSRLSLSQPLESFTSSLRAAGVKIASEGLVDLDNDARDELWFMIEPPTQMYYQLWIASNYPNGIQVFDAGTYPNAISKLTLKPITSTHTLIDLGQPAKLLWTRDSTTHKPTLKSLYEWQDPNDLTDYGAINTDIKEFERLQLQFYLNDNPAGIYEDFLAIAKNYVQCPYLLYYPSATLYEYACGNYYYTIGFAAELANDNNMAQKMYETVLEKYPTNPMALLAKNKLNQ